MCDYSLCGIPNRLAVEGGAVLGVAEGGPLAAVPSQSLGQEERCEGLAAARRAIQADLERGFERNRFVESRHRGGPFVKDGG